ncbi:MAG: histidine triad nucleotide-binding protein [Candidatus Omnitrophota bacterium]
MNDSCVFCKIANGKIPADLVYEDDDMVAFKDIDPRAPVHILFIPRKHIETVNDISRDDAGLMARMILAAKDMAAEKGISGEGYRIVINCMKNAGQEVFHLHLHLLGGRVFSWPPG